MATIKLTEDGNVTKKILREGVGTLPEPNNTVTGKHLSWLTCRVKIMYADNLSVIFLRDLVHYESILADTDVVFDSSRQRKAEFVFTLNSGIEFG